VAEKGISCDELTAHESSSIRMLCSDASSPRATQRTETLRSIRGTWEIVRRFSWRPSIGDPTRKVLILQMACVRICESYIDVIHNITSPDRYTSFMLLGVNVTDRYRVI
jgi:hypothetical protein